jgi:hypothetical protein
MNNAAILPYIFMHALQIQNIKRDVVKKASISEINREIIHPEDNQEAPIKYDYDNSMMAEHMLKDHGVGTNINELPDTSDIINETNDIIDTNNTSSNNNTSIINNID